MVAARVRNSPRNRSWIFNQIAK